MKMNKIFKVFMGTSIFSVAYALQSNKKLLEINTTTTDLKMSLKEAIKQSTNLLINMQKANSCPGVSIAVSVNGKDVWTEAFGLSDVENNIPCTTNTVFKIASISKSITSAILAQEYELGHLDLDEDICKYISYWPEKVWNKKKVKLTLRDLASHKAGIRGYNIIKDSTLSKDILFEEYWIRKSYKNAAEAVDIFKNDLLISLPGTEFNYSNHGYTLISSVIDAVSKKSFPILLSEFFRKLGMKSSTIDSEKLVYGSSRYYMLKNGKLVNAPLPENSFKLAAAGMVSTPSDLTKFANALLYSYQYDSLKNMISNRNVKSHEDYNSKSTISLAQNNNDNIFFEINDTILKPPLFKTSTLKSLWKPVDNSEVSWSKNGSYGLGWQIVYNDNGDLYIGHTGRTIGASSALMIGIGSKDKFHHKMLLLNNNNNHNLEKKDNTFNKNIYENTNRKKIVQCQGVVVAILCNMQGISLGPIAIQIAEFFENSI